jgi:hypothetical protein
MLWIFFIRSCKSSRSCETPPGTETLTDVRTGRSCKFVYRAKASVDGNVSFQQPVARSGMILAYWLPPLCSAIHIDKNFNSQHGAGLLHIHCTRQRPSKIVRSVRSRRPVMLRVTTIQRALATTETLTLRLFMRLRSSSKLPTPRRRPGDAGL